MSESEVHWYRWLKGRHRCYLNIGLPIGCRRLTIVTFSFTVAW